MRGFKTIFDFTFRQLAGAASYKRLTIILALLLFLLPAIIMPVVESSRGDRSSPEPEPPAMEEFMPEPENLETWTMTDRVDKLYCDLETDDVTVDGLKEVLTGLEGAEFIEMRPPYESSDGTEPDGPVLHIFEGEDGYAVLVASTYPEVEDILTYRVISSFEEILMASAGIPAETRQVYLDRALAAETDYSDVPQEEEESDGSALVQEILSMALPYVNVMLIYFLVLFYGQNTSGSVILEKTSKLMDTFLISVKPKAMIFGKVLAICAAGVLQFAIWVIAAVAGFAVGTALVRMINPATTMGLVRFFSILGSASGMFTPGAVIIAVLMIVAGMLLYSSMASIGGALAGKPEDLSSTNIFFTLILVVSFLCTLYSGFLSRGMPQGVRWIDIVPFTAILITPSRLLLGYIPLWAGALSLLIVILAAAVIMLLAGRIYKMMSFYKGNPPKLNDVLKMLREKQTEY
ncbi:MAG: ABC transporter permease [Oscillospiraceae bacterium]|nr:ABC transporter permease [Oscillospiraceae bacterium]